MSTLSKHPVLVAGSILLWLLFGSELLSVDRSATETPPTEPVTQQPVLRLEESTGLRLATGAFHGGAVETKGNAAVFELSNGKHILRLTELETANEPDLRVLLIAASDATDGDTVRNSAPIELGRLRSSGGDQIYPIPAGVDLDRYRAVTIWSPRLGANLGTAPLD